METEQSGLDVMSRCIYHEIKRQYKSVRSFSEKTGVPYSTVYNLITRGADGVAFSTVQYVLDMLNIKNGIPVWARELGRKFMVLDKESQEYVYTVLNKEVERCQREYSDDCYKLEIEEEEPQGRESVRETE